jgi:hypothetical protein
MELKKSVSLIRWFLEVAVVVSHRLACNLEVFVNADLFGEKACIGKMA